MTTSTHHYHGYELVLNHESDDRYQVTIFDPKGNQIASTGTHLERQGALTEASRYRRSPFSRHEGHMRRARRFGTLFIEASGDRG